MGKIILVFNGSAREKGNTDSVVAKFIEGAKSSDLEVHNFMLRDLSIGNCKGCYKCKSESVCDLNDDMTKIREGIEKSDVLVFASPVYWCEVTGLMKTFIDRLYFYHHPNTAELIAGKKAVVLTTLGESSNIDYETEILIEFYRRAFKSLKIDLIKHLVFSGLMEAEAIQNRPEYLQQSFSFGKNLINILS
ncbi:MAG: hypothetical protein A2V66_14965 [Ignavibacteria bacterium RBG_13_36_8]|nr:MAG: hypothetical protein A2V66_14965 [Ignavibacteria bacterium RBG_13_36_8]